VQAFHEICRKMSEIIKARGELKTYYVAEER
jgi:hypothetical protein